MQRHNRPSRRRAGSKICLLQTSPEAVPVFALLRLALDGGYAAAEAAALFAVFAANFIDNAGNYKSFGDTKFVPALPAARFHAVLSALPGYRARQVSARDRGPPSTCGHVVPFTYLHTNRGVLPSRHGGRRRRSARSSGPPQLGRCSTLARPGCGSWDWGRRRVRRGRAREVYGLRQ
jgi:hypothetical protein